MKKTALLCIAAILVIGIQSCSIEEQEEIAPQNLSTTKKVLNKGFTHPLLLCKKTIYVNFGTLSFTARAKFREDAKRRWFNSIIVQESSCPSVEIWLVPCERIYYGDGVPKNDEEEEIVIDAEESMTLSEGGAAHPPYTGRPPVYEPNSSFIYTICTTVPETIDPNPDNDDDGDTGDTVGIPVQ